MGWDEDQEFERKWWGNCVNSFREEMKQLVYAKKMGINMTKNCVLDLQGNVLDIGGGPVSILLKCPKVKGTIVVNIQIGYIIDMMQQASDILKF